MGRQSSAKARTPGAQPPTSPPSRGSGLSWFIAVAVAVLAIGGFVFLRGSGVADQAAAAPQTDAERKAALTDVHPSPEDEAAAHARAAVGPHKQKDFPPIPFRGYAPPRPAAVVTAAFQWAAEHPEIASYVPCFCGCQMMGHRGNDQCFVHARNDKGDVVEWEEHGVDCAICIDVATRSRQMYAAGASARDIRAAIEKEFTPTAQTMTPTPRPPAN
jgi:hypothetical protein